jgi:hypothetical protein
MSKRPAVLIVAALLAVAAFPAAPLPAAAMSLVMPNEISPGTVNRSTLLVDATYDVRVRLTYATGDLTIDSTMNVTNRASYGIDRLDLNTVAARVGGLKIDQATVDGHAVSPTIEDQTVHLPLGGILASGNRATVRLVGRARLSASVAGHAWLFSKANGIVNAYRWLPWVSREHPFDRPNYGDPFVTPVSPWVRVAITTDRPIVFATSGKRVASEGLTQVFRADDVRDFNFTASPGYRQLTEMVGTVKVRAYALTTVRARALLDRATWAVRHLSALVGPFPYPQYFVAESSGGYAMESPAHAWIPPVDSSRFPYLVTHETAHQWFYGEVGNDQATQPFADEAMADFLTRTALASFRSSGCSSNRLDLTIYRYSSACYYELVYVKGANVINEVRRRMGNATFWSALRAYLAEYKGRISGTGQLLRFLDGRTSQDLSSYYRTYFPSLYP